MWITFIAGSLLVFSERRKHFTYVDELKKNNLIQNQAWTGYGNRALYLNGRERHKFSCFARWPHCSYVQYRPDHHNHMLFHRFQLIQLPHCRTVMNFKPSTAYMVLSTLHTMWNKCLCSNYFWDIGKVHA